MMQVMISMMNGRDFHDEILMTEGRDTQEFTDEILPFEFCFQRSRFDYTEIRPQLFSCKIVLSLKGNVRNLKPFNLLLML